MLELVLEFKSYAQSITLVLVAIAAWRFGDLPEKACASVLVGVLWVADMVFWAGLGLYPDFVSTEVPALVLDVLALVLLLVIALFANRIYPLCLTSIQGLALLSHFAAAAASAVPLAYAILSIAPSYLLIAVMAAGLFAHHRREQLHGPYRQWRLKRVPLPAKS